MTRILLVEDHADTRYVTAHWLRYCGFDVVEADSGAAAVEQVEHDGIDLILCDIDLPDMTGVDVMRRVRTMFDGPALAMTAHRTLNNKQGDLATLFNGHLVKPVDPLALEASIRQLI